jgi:hypothetical protein
MGTGGFSSGSKAAGAWSWPFTFQASAEVKKIWIYTSTPPTPSWRSTWLVKHRGNFTFLPLHCCTNTLVGQGEALFYYDGTTKSPLGISTSCEIGCRQGHNAQIGYGTHQPPIQLVPRAVPPEVGRQGHEAPCSAEVNNGGAIPSLSHTSSWCGA